MIQEEEVVRERLRCDKLFLASVTQRLNTVMHQHNVDKLSLDALQKKVAEAETDISELSAMQSSLEASITRRCATLTPRSLPTFPLEMLGMIFELATDAHAQPWVRQDDPREVTPGRTLQPFKCAAVCRRWHSASLATPSLWTYIGVPNCCGEKRCAMWLSRVQQLLHRSGACRLHVAIELPPEGCHFDYPLILADLLRNCARWQYLSVLGFDYHDPCYDTLRLLHQPTPALEAIFLAFLPTGEDLPWPPRPPTYLPYAPKLCVLHLEHVPVALSRNGPDLQVPSLSLIEDTYFLPRFRQTVAAFAGLRTLKLCWENANSGNVSGIQSPIHLPELQSLVLCRDPNAGSAFQPASFALILDNIAAPRLRTLDIDPEILPLASRLARRAASTIESLYLREGTVVAPLVLSAISPWTALRDVTFDDCVLEGDFLDGLRVVPGGVWPRLQRLSLVTSRKVDEDAFLRFLRARYPINGATNAPQCALLDVDLSRDALRDSVAAGEIWSILENEKQRRRSVAVEGSGTIQWPCLECSTMGRKPLHLDPKAHLLNDPGTASRALRVAFGHLASAPPAIPNNSGR
ncbi:hypothetical protein AURDEDRAFT_122644 [Auricularia subglabra TFB-10046 SS5]|nr:hypothetical protein AURDEDRAFT_122644 [Auricularia subglabra TFB-10046 SS5]